MGDNNRVQRYETLAFLGEGQFATVYKAKDLLWKPEEVNVDDPEVNKVAGSEDRIVAIKKIKLGSRAEARDGINRTALREIKLLQELDHENIICLVDVFGHKSNVSIVMDFMDTDLEVVIKTPSVVLSVPHVKAYILQTLLGLEYLHANWILHRDLKPNNLLVNRRGVLKIGDFGLAKAFASPNRQYTHIVVTRWYRSPELLFGARKYGTGVDMWAVGCILAEMLLRTPFFPGDTDLDQLTKIFSALGTPNEDTWPNHTQLPDYVQFKVFPPTRFEDIFTAASKDLIEVLSKMLTVDPLRRCNCTEALNMDFFKNKPYPTPREQLPVIPGEGGADAVGAADAKDGGDVDARAKLKRRRPDDQAASSLKKRLIF